MSDERTTEQRAADDHLEAAIRDLIAAYVDTPGLLMEWVLVTAQHHDEGNGDTATAVGHWVAPHQPFYRSLGLLDYATTRLRATIAGNADTDGDQ